MSGRIEWGTTMDDWQHQLEAARTEDEVVRSAGDYLVLRAPRGLDAMDIGLPEMRIASSHDIERVHRTLRKRDAWPSRESREFMGLMELASFFGLAADRVGALRAR
jgi:hypothetical protein